MRTFAKSLRSEVFVLLGVEPIALLYPHPHSSKLHPSPEKLFTCPRQGDLEALSPVTDYILTGHFVPPRFL